MRWLAAGCILLCGCGEKRPANLVRMVEIPRDIRYATENNFTHKRLYDAADCLMRPATRVKLLSAQQEFKRKGWSLKLYDCYRPLSVQRQMWALVPDERYVADPKKGSRHNRGAAVDVTLVDLQGAEVTMPTEYDDFSERAHRNYGGLTAEAISNRQVLETVMQNRQRRQAVLSALSTSSIFIRAATESSRSTINRLR